jgi:hypothetical protein
MKSYMQIGLSGLDFVCLVGVVKSHFGHNHASGTDHKKTISRYGEENYFVPYYAVFCFVAFTKCPALAPDLPVCVATQSNMHCL